MSDHRCGACRHAKLGERVLNAGKPSEWIDRLGYCDLASRHADAMRAASVAIGVAPFCLGRPGAAMIGPDHGATCGAWEAK